MKKDLNYKVLLQKYGIFVLVFAIVILILIYSSIFAQKYWRKNLKATIENVLLEQNLNEFQILENIDIHNSFTLNAAAYKAYNKEEKKDYTLIILRVQTLYGPIPAVFSMNEEGNVNFISYTSIHGRIEKQLDSRYTSKRISYWIQKIPEIIK